MFWMKTSSCSELRSSSRPDQVQTRCTNIRRVTAKPGASGAGERFGDGGEDRGESCDSGYLGGDGNVSTGGLSSLTVDNGQNSSDMLVKLFDRRFERPVAVRVFFLPAYEQFKLEDITAGAYEIRYQNLDSGIISKSQPFNLEEIQEPDGTRKYTVMTLTLYVVVNGNTRSETIGPEEF